MPPAATPPEGIYLRDLYDPRRRISREYFPAFALLLGVTPIMIFFGVPTVLSVLANKRPGDGLLFGHEPMAIAPYFFTPLFVAHGYVLVVVSINRMRAAGKSPGWLLVPGYNLWLLFTAPDSA
ncbi:hypothetical protein [Lewinella sp. IMCC34183]|uniref:hypothetical protein n=1 Tax=Lewinella sp. IMCC34183 TaxID=2248762 RepID=UPI000E249BC7|nr:hypothetical protein [Lewinella sp. IMCC34183]